MSANLRMFCSFCGQSDIDVEFLIAGPGVMICDDCVETCQIIISERRASQPATANFPFGPDGNY